MDDQTHGAKIRGAGAPARAPTDISARGWTDVLWQSGRAMFLDSTALAAAGIAFYVVWAMFPALAVGVVLAAELLGRDQVVGLLGWLRLDLPQSFDTVVVAQLDAIARHAPAISVATVLVGVVLATWSGMRGARGLMSALNDVYGERERRSFWHREALALALTLLGGAFLLAALVLIVGLAGSSGEHTRPATTALLAPSRWPVLIVAMVLLLAVSYRYAPCHRAPKWRWVTWGASVSATIWVLVSFAFSYFAAHFTHVNPLLGSLGSVVMFLFWCYLTVLVVLLGAHINAQLEEHRTTDATARKASGAHEASLARKPPAAARRKATRRTRRH